jgi:hypothetical protein
VPSQGRGSLSVLERYLDMFVRRGGDRRVIAENLYVLKRAATPQAHRPFEQVTSLTVVRCRASLGDELSEREQVQPVSV